MPANCIRVWDPLIRLFHWGLVGAVAVSWLTQEEDYELHLLAGYGVLELTVLRLVWGFVGTRHARFSDFVRTPYQVLAYLRQLARGHAPRSLGHNPAGGVMIVLLLLVMLTLALSGVALDAAENRAGPLADTRLFLYTEVIRAIHVWATDAALMLIALHLLGVAHASWVHRENLVRSMITGGKPLRTGPFQPAED
jgi:cytochrome b